MPTLIGVTSKIPKYARYANEIAFSIYLPGLLIWVNDVSSRWANQPGDRVPWVLQLKFFITGDYGRHDLGDDPKLRFAFILLWVLSAVGVFLLLRILARLSFTHVLLRTFAGIVAIAGFPLTLVYAYLGAPHAQTPGRSVAGFSWALVEVAAALVCAFLYVSGRWPHRVFWAISLLVVHSAFWSFCAWGMRDSLFPWGGVPLLWPGYNLTRLTLETPQLIYPWLGSLATVAWALYARHGSRRPEALAQNLGAADSRPKT